MKEEDIIALLALQHTPNVGDITAKKLIAHCGSPAAIYQEKKHKIAHIGRIGNVILQHLFDPAHREAAENGAISKTTISATILSLIVITLRTSSKSLMLLSFFSPAGI